MMEIVVNVFSHVENTVAYIIPTLWILVAITAKFPGNVFGIYRVMNQRPHQTSEFADPVVCLSYRVPEHWLIDPSLEESNRAAAFAG